MIKINRILCPVDFFPASEKAALYATELAVNYGAVVRLLHVVTPIIPTAYRYPLNPVDSRKLMEDAAAKEMTKLAESLKTKGAKVQTEIRSGDIHDALEDAISRTKPDLIAMGTHGRRGLERWVLGSVTEWLIRHSPAPVLTLSAKERPAHPVFRSILVTTDFSDGAANALAYALSIAELNKSRVTLLHVIDSTTLDFTGAYRSTLLRGVQKQLEDVAARNASGIESIATRVEEGAPYQTILRIIEKDKPSLVVMNIHGKGMLERALLGSTAERVVRGAQCPILLVPPMRKTRSAANPRTTRRLAAGR